MPTPDLTGPQQAPDGEIVGLYFRVGDSYYPLNKGPVIPAIDPISGLTRYFRSTITIVNNGDGTTSVVPGLDEIFL